MKKNTIFQTGVIIFFIAASLLAITIFALTKAKNTSGVTNIVVWGTIDENSMNTMIQLFNGEQSNYVIKYAYKSDTGFEAALVDALALGNGPDAVLVGEDHILKLENKLFTIPYANYPERTFKDLFIQSGEQLLRPDGIVGLPIAIDPLIMYWNRDMFTTAGIAQPPKYWDEFYALAPKLSKYDTTLHVTKSAVALGEISNVLHGKDVILTLWNQAGGKGFQTSAEAQDDQSPLAAALRFYTQFSDPTKKTYSWNRSLPLSRDMFTAGNLGVYFGFGSELPLIQEKNGNLNFDVAPIPQTRDAETPSGLGKIYSYSIIKNSAHITEAFMVGAALTTVEGNKRVADVLKLPPARRDLLAQPPSDAWGPLFYSSAIQATSWLDPDPVATSDIFKSAVEDIVAGRRSPAESALEAQTQIHNLY